MVVTVSLINCLMEGVDRVDYSSDQIEGSDIWGMPGGGDLEQLADLPLMGTVDLSPGGFESKQQGVDFSPSNFLSLSPTRPFFDDPHTKNFGNLSVDLPGSSSWSESNLFLSQNLEFLVPRLHEGFEVIEGFE